MVNITYIHVISFHFKRRENRVPPFFGTVPRPLSPLPFPGRACGPPARPSLWCGSGRGTAGPGPCEGRRRGRSRHRYRTNRSISQNKQTEEKDEGEGRRETLTADLLLSTGGTIPSLFFPTLKNGVDQAAPPKRSEERRAPPPNRRK